MRKFLGKRWHRLPIGIITAVLAVCLLVGGVLAAYPFWSGTAKVTVVEPMTVTYISNTAGSWDGTSTTWTVSVSPGSSEQLVLRVTNNGKGTLTITPTDDSTWAAWAASGDSTLAGIGDYEDFTLTVAVPGDAIPIVDKVIQVAFARG